jgi:hypothetical protein
MHGMRFLLPCVLVAACGADPGAGEDPSDTTSSDLGTTVLAPDVSRLVQGPTGDIEVMLRSGGVSVLDPATSALASVAGRSGYLAGSGVTFDFGGSAFSSMYLSRKDAAGVETKLPQTLYDPSAIGFDASYFYFYARTSDYYYGDHAIYRIGLAPGAALENVGWVGNGENEPDPLTTLTAGGGVYWTTLPNTCSLGDSDSCWQIALGRTDGTRVTPRLADGTYVGFSAIASYGGDLYAASSSAIYKLPGGDLGKPLEQVCAIPSSLKVKLSNSTILVGVSRAGFAATSRGFIVPVQSSDYRSALALVRWNCTTKMLTTFGAPAGGSVSSYGLTQVSDIVVRGNEIFWLDRQPWTAGDEYGDSYYALKKTTF